MSILQEYEKIRKSNSPKENKAIDQFLETHPQYLRCWNHQELNNINKYIKLIDSNILAKDDIKNIYIEVCNNPKLQECVIKGGMKETTKDLEKKHSKKNKKINVGVIKMNDKKTTIDRYKILTQVKVAKTTIFIGRGVDW